MVRAWFDQASVVPSSGEQSPLKHVSLHAHLAALLVYFDVHAPLRTFAHAASDHSGVLVIPPREVRMPAATSMRECPGGVWRTRSTGFLRLIRDRLFRPLHEAVKNNLSYGAQAMREGRGQHFYLPLFHPDGQTRNSDTDWVSPRTSASSW